MISAASEPVKLVVSIDIIRSWSSGAVGEFLAQDIAVGVVSVDEISYGGIIGVGVDEAVAAGG